MIWIECKFEFRSNLIKIQWFPMIMTTMKYSNNKQKINLIRTGIFHMDFFLFCFHQLIGHNELGCCFVPKQNFQFCLSLLLLLSDWIQNTNMHLYTHIYRLIAPQHTHIHSFIHLTWQNQTKQMKMMISLSFSLSILFIFSLFFVLFCYKCTLRGKREREWERKRK